jgi:hypothetical protein
MLCAVCGERHQERMQEIMREIWSRLLRRDRDRWLFSFLIKWRCSRKWSTLWPCASSTWFSHVQCLRVHLINAKYCNKYYRDAGFPFVVACLVLVSSVSCKWRQKVLTPSSFYTPGFFLPKPYSSISRQYIHTWHVTSTLLETDAGDNSKLNYFTVNYKVIADMEDSF